MDTSNGEGGLENKCTGSSGLRGVLIASVSAVRAGNGRHILDAYYTILRNCSGYA